MKTATKLISVLLLFYVVGIIVYPAVHDLLANNLAVTAVEYCVLFIYIAGCVAMFAISIFKNAELLFYLFNRRGLYASVAWNVNKKALGLTFYVHLLSDLMNIFSSSMVWPGALLRRYIYMSATARMRKGGSLSADQHAPEDDTASSDAKERPTSLHFVSNLFGLPIAAVDLLGTLFLFAPLIVLNESLHAKMSSMATTLAYFLLSHSVIFVLSMAISINTLPIRLRRGPLNPVFNLISFSIITLVNMSLCLSIIETKGDISTSSLIFATFKSLITNHEIFYLYRRGFIVDIVTVKVLCSVTVYYFLISYLLRRDILRRSDEDICEIAIAFLSIGDNINSLWWLEKLKVDSQRSLLIKGQLFASENDTERADFFFRQFYTILSEEEISTVDVNALTVMELASSNVDLGAYAAKKIAALLDNGAHGVVLFGVIISAITSRTLSKDNVHSIAALYSPSMWYLSAPLLIVDGHFSKLSMLLRDVSIENMDWYCMLFLYLLSINCIRLNNCKTRSERRLRLASGLVERQAGIARCVEHIISDTHSSVSLNSLMLMHIEMYKSMCAESEVIIEDDLNEKIDAFTSKVSAHKMVRLMHSGFSTIVESMVK